MFGIGLPEFILILALALIVVGPDKLPDLARSVAKGILDLKKTANTLKESLTEEGNPFDEIKPELEKAAKALTDDVLGNDKDDWSGKNRDKIYPVAGKSQLPRDLSPFALRVTFQTLKSLREEKSPKRWNSMMEWVSVKLISCSRLTTLKISRMLSTCTFTMIWNSIAFRASLNGFRLISKAPGLSTGSRLYHRANQRVQRTVTMARTEHLLSH